MANSESIRWNFFLERENKQIWNNDLKIIRNKFELISSQIVLPINQLIYRQCMIEKPRISLLIFESIESNFDICQPEKRVSYVSESHFFPATTTKTNNSHSISTIKCNAQIFLDLSFPSNVNEFAVYELELANFSQFFGARESTI